MASEDSYLNSGLWFKHSCTPEGDTRFDALKCQYASEGYTVFFNALQYIYKGKCGELELKTIANNYRIPFQRVMEIMEFMENECEGIIHRGEDGNWTSDRALKEIERSKNTQESRKTWNATYYNKSKEFKKFLRTTEDELKTDLSTYQDNLKKLIREDKIREEYKETIKNKFFMKESGEVASNSTEKKASKFVSLNPPTLDEVKAYGATLSLPFDAEAFHDHFTSNGWKVSGKAPMKDWKAAARNWARNGVTIYDSKPPRNSQHPERMTHQGVREQDLVGFEEGEL